MKEHTILLVDDDKNLLEGLKRGMKKENFNILTANSGDEAIKILETKIVDIIVTDEKMPGMSGSKLTAFVRNKYPHILCMILSGQSDLDSAIKAINEGEIYRFLTKPCSILNLVMHIRSAIDHLSMLKKIREMENLIAHQKNIINKLEKQHPGITNIKKDADGYIILDDE